MLAFNIILVIALLATSVSCLKASEITNVETNVVQSNSSDTALLTQLRVQKSDSADAVYTYQCTVGSYVSSRVACSGSDSTSWPSPQNVELKLRCPRSGSSAALSYVFIQFSVTSPNVNCFVNQGGIGAGYIGVTINAWSTQLLSYSAYFYYY